VKYSELADVDCAIAQALGVVGDWWTLLVVRDIAGGTTRFDDLQRELDVSRKTLTERLKALVANGVVEKVDYSAHPPRFEYHLTEKGRGLLPVLISLQDWGTRYVSGDGSLTATTRSTSAEARRVQGLVGRRIPEIGLWSHENGLVDPVVDGAWTLLYAFPGAFVPIGNPLPPDWADIPGAAGCTLEATTYRDRYQDFHEAGIVVRGLSTQRPDQLNAFVQHVNLPYLLLSDEDLLLTAALRLPTFRAAGVDRLKRMTMIIDPERTIRSVRFPITDPARTADEAMAMVGMLRDATVG
jgi:DNA-binding HxlR family transcriptional regulator/peroxiredoxin